MYERTISQTTVYEGTIFSVDRLEIEQESGRRAMREIVRHGPAVAILPRLPDGRFIFIRQFRKAMETICFEVVAGNCDPGEEAERSAARELQEETGWQADSLTPLGPIFPCIGYCTERIDIFLADVTVEGERSLDEDEQIDTLMLSEAEMDARIGKGEVSDAKTLAAWMLYKSYSMSLET